MSTMYTLTAMTGKEASANRTTVIGSVELNWRVWMILIWASPVALLVTLFTWPIFGQISLLAIPIVECGAIFMLHRRSSKGLRLRTYQALWDKKKAALNTFLLCGRKIDIGSSNYRILKQNTVSYGDAVSNSAHAAYVDQLAAQRQVPVPVHAAVSPSRRIVSDPTSQVAGAQPQQVIPVPTRGHAPHSPRSCPSTPPSAISRLDQSLIGREGEPDAVDAGDLLDVDEADRARGVGVGSGEDADDSNDWFFDGP